MRQQQISSPACCRLCGFCENIIRPLLSNYRTWQTPALPTLAQRLHYHTSSRLAFPSGLQSSFTALTYPICWPGHRQTRGMSMPSTFTDLGMWHCPMFLRMLLPPGLARWSFRFSRGPLPVAWAWRVKPTKATCTKSFQQVLFQCTNKHNKLQAGRQLWKRYIYSIYRNCSGFRPVLQESTLLGGVVGCKWVSLKPHIQQKLLQRHSCFSSLPLLSPMLQVIDIPNKTHMHQLSAWSYKMKAVLFSEGMKQSGVAVLIARLTIASRPFLISLICSSLLLPLVKFRGSNTPPARNSFSILQLI